MEMCEVSPGQRELPPDIRALINELETLRRRRVAIHNELREWHRNVAIELRGMPVDDNSDYGVAVNCVIDAWAPMQFAEIAAVTGLQQSSIRSYMAKAVARGHLDRVGVGMYAPPAPCAHEEGESGD